MTERIRIEVDDSDLDRFILRMNLVLQEVRSAFGTTDVKEGARSALSDFQTLGLAMSTFSDDELALLTDRSRLPTMNREMRIATSMIPGMREFNSLFFNIKRIERGFLLGGNPVMTAVAIVALELRRQMMVQKKNEQQIEFLRTQFSDYFADPGKLNLFALLQKLTDLEKLVEIVIGLLAQYGDDQQVRAFVDLGGETE